jgi:hypothetical protein
MLLRLHGQPVRMVVNCCAMAEVRWRRRSLLDPGGARMLGLGSRRCFAFRRGRAGGRFFLLAVVEEVFLE